jgi:hypothetical protein
LLNTQTNLVLDGDINLTLNGLGIQFLSRNLVTLDFPQKTLYLKRTSFGHLVDRNMRSMADSEGKSAYRFILHLKNEGQLPGWSKDEEIPDAQIH